MAKAKPSGLELVFGKGKGGDEPPESDTDEETETETDDEDDDFAEYAAEALGVDDDPERVDALKMAIRACIKKYK